jgi:hypothetical protein
MQQHTRTGTQMCCTYRYPSWRSKQLLPWCSVARTAGQHYGHVCVTARRIMVQLYSSAWQPRQTSIERTSGLLFVGRGKPDAVPVPATVSLFVDPYRARCAVLQAEVLHFFVDSHEQAASSQAGTTEAG